MGKTTRKWHKFDFKKDQENDYNRKRLVIKNMFWHCDVCGNKIIDY